MAEVAVLGIGNTLMRDDGIGVRLMEGVRDARWWPDGVEFIDGGAGGLGLLNVIESARRLVVFDSAEMGLTAGKHRVIGEEHLAADTGEHRVSLHDLSFEETLRLCRLASGGPETVAILAVQPGVVGFGRELSGQVQAALGHLIEEGVRLVVETLGGPTRKC
jgi:hydrogenase maturation protease